MHNKLYFKYNIQLYYYLHLQRIIDDHMNDLDYYPLMQTYIKGSFHPLFFYKTFCSLLSSPYY